MGRPHRIALLSLLSLGIAAGASCGEPEEPAPETEPVVEEAPPEPEPEPETPFVEHVVGEGQTLWHIARAYGVTVDEVMEFNEMTRRDVRRLSKGRSLRIPGATEVLDINRDANRPPSLEDLPALEDGAYHFLAEGETLWDLAHTYNLTVSAIMERNELDDDGVRMLRPGRPLIVPGVAQEDVRSADSAAESRGLRHTVARGETIWDLARSFRVSVSQIMAANRLSREEAAALRAGERLWIPASRAPSQLETTGLAPRQRQALARARRLGLGSKQVAQSLLHGHVERRWMRAAGGIDRMPGTLRWPVSNGRFVRGFGSGEGNYHLAVDIAGDIGWNVRSAARGIVAYSGDEVPGYGNMVLVVHPGGWVTMYAHNSVNFVVAGEEVPRGGVLAELGSSGISRGPHVHFEFIYDSQNCDPASLFRPGVRHESRLARIPQATWRNPSRRPEEVICHRRRRHPRSRWVVNE